MAEPSPERFTRSVLDLALQARLRRLRNRPAIPVGRERK
jgi:hypothetical protein